VGGGGARTGTARTWPSILAKLGHHVDTVEMSTVACEKIERFARSEGVRVRVRNEPVETADLTGADYGLVLMNGWKTLYHAYERGRVEHSHPGLRPHAHSHIKLIAARDRNRTEDQ
jgi:hypothetical protein